MQEVLKKMLFVAKAQKGNDFYNGERGSFIQKVVHRADKENDICVEGNSGKNCFNTESSSGEDDFDMEGCSGEDSFDVEGGSGGKEFN